MIDSQPGASKPRWKVQLELAPAEIALVYRQGLARGAEVCRRGTQDWRPLVTTPELRPALVGRASWPEFVDTSIPDSAVTQPLPIRVVPETPSEFPAAVFTPAPVVQHARSAELSLVAALSVAVTLAAALLAQRAAHWTEVRAAISPSHAPSTVARPRAASPAPASVWSSALASTVPVVLLHDLPVERASAAFKGTGRGGRSGASGAGGVASGGADRGEFARALSQAARAARSCGEGPVHTQVVATFAPSGAPRSVSFGGSPPPAALRNCVLSAVARARVPPFVGDSVTVAKTLSW